MNLAKTLVLLSISIFFCGCGVLQSIAENSNSYNELDLDTNVKANNSGKCYAKCLIQKSRTIYSSDKYAIYTGNEEEENVDVSMVKVVLKPSSTKWVKKKKADKTCHSVNPEDCMVWCIVYEPRVTKHVKVLLDTSQSPNFEYRRVSYEEEPEPEDGHTEWREVLCDVDLTSEIIDDIQKALKDFGYFYGSETYEFDSETKKALIAFQRDRELPIGNVDFETLSALRVSVE